MFSLLVFFYLFLYKIDVHLKCALWIMSTLTRDFSISYTFALIHVTCAKLKHYPKRKEAVEKKRKETQDGESKKKKKKFFLVCFFLVKPFFGNTSRKENRKKQFYSFT